MQPNFWKRKNKKKKESETSLHQRALKSFLHQPQLFYQFEKENQIKASDQPNMIANKMMVKISHKKFQI